MRAVEGAERVLDVGCGSGRLTAALAAAAVQVVGIDTSPERLEQARQRAEELGVSLELREADFNAALPFAAASFDAATSRLALMAAADAAATLVELARVVAPGGRVATALWARPAENPWFAEPRAALAVVGPERARFARAFGRLGELEEAAAVHLAAGLVDVVSRTLRGEVRARSAREHWQHMVEANGHFTRADARLAAGERRRVVEELERRLAPFHLGAELVMPRAQVLVTARVAD